MSIFEDRVDQLYLALEDFVVEPSSNNMNYLISLMHEFKRWSDSIEPDLDYYEFLESEVLPDYDEPFDYEDS